MVRCKVEMMKSSRAYCPHLPLHGGSPAPVILPDLSAHPVHEAYDVLHILVRRGVRVIWKGERHAAAQAAEECVPARGIQIACNLISHWVWRHCTGAILQVGVLALHAFLLNSVHIYTCCLADRRKGV